MPIGGGRGQHRRGGGCGWRCRGSRSGWRGRGWCWRLGLRHNVLLRTLTVESGPERRVLNEPALALGAPAAIAIEAEHLGPCADTAQDFARRRGHDRREKDGCQTKCFGRVVQRLRERVGLGRIFRKRPRRMGCDVLVRGIDDPVSSRNPGMDLEAVHGLLIVARGVIADASQAISSDSGWRQ